MNEMRHLPWWHEVGRLDAIAGKLLQGGGRNAEPTQLVFFVRLNKDGNMYQKYKCTTMFKERNYVGLAVNKDNIGDDVFDTTMECYSRDEDMMYKWMKDLNGVLLHQR